MSISSDADCAIEIQGLTRKFRTTLALSDLNLKVPKGCVFGLLGENGAGKTTLIKHIMGLLRPQTGSVRVLGGDPIADPVGTLGRVGYLSEDRDIPKWMKISELMQYTQGFYPHWDENFAAELLEIFDLNPAQKIKTLSLGQTAKVGILQALAHRPELVVLDEPSSGLDAVVRRHILSSAIRTVAREGRTVLFSSHLLDEVESVSDYIAIIDGGRVLVCDRVENVLGSHGRIDVTLKSGETAPPKVAGVLHWEDRHEYWIGVGMGTAAELQRAAIGTGLTVTNTQRPTLEEIFLARIGAQGKSGSTDSGLTS
jgi:ABC-type multidrug transport system ATPase subunit